MFTLTSSGCSNDSLRYWKAFRASASCGRGERSALGFCDLRPVLTLIHGPGSSVGIATDYGLDGPGSNPGGDEIFRLPRPALGPTQPPVQWVPDLSRR